MAKLQKRPQGRSRRIVKRLLLAIANRLKFYLDEDLIARLEQEVLGLRSQRLGDLAEVTRELVRIFVRNKASMTDLSDSFRTEGYDLTIHIHSYRQLPQTVLGHTLAFMHNAGVSNASIGQLRHASESLFAAHPDNTDVAWLFHWVELAHINMRQLAIYLQQQGVRLEHTFTVTKCSEDERAVGELARV